MIVYKISTIGMHAIITLSAPWSALLGCSKETLSQPRRLGSLPCPLQIFVLHPKCLCHILPSQGIPTLLVILATHSQGLETPHLSRLINPTTCSTSQVQNGWRIRPNKQNNKNKSSKHYE